MHWDLCSARVVLTEHLEELLPRECALGVEILLDLLPAVDSDEELLKMGLFALERANDDEVALVEECEVLVHGDREEVHVQTAAAQRE